MAIRLIVDGGDLTDAAGDLQWTTVDPGGFETCQFTLPDTATVPAPGAPIVIWEGMQRVWMGNVEEPGDEFRGDQAPGTVNGVGAGALLKDNDLSMIYMDRDLSVWKPASAQRRIDTSATRNISDATVAPGSGGAPMLAEAFDDQPWSTSGLPDVESYYDAGDGNVIASIKADWQKGGNVDSSNANWQWDAIIADDDGFAVGTFDTRGNLRAAGPSSVSVGATTSTRRIAVLRHLFNAANAGSTSKMFAIYWSNVRVIGDHGLTIRGATSAEEGFYAEDIAAHALSTIDGIVPGVIEASGRIVIHSAYRDPVAQEQIIDDMAKLLGWHWGVWEPLSMLEDTPRLDFRAPPAAATAIVARSDCQLKLTKQLSAMHDQARVFYTDAAGQRGNVLVSLPNAQLPAGRHRTLTLDMGAGDADAAEIYGGDALALEQQQTRAAGSGELPPEVITVSGGRKLAHLLKPGIDRLKIMGLPNTGPWTDDDTARYDTFRIARLTAARQTGGGVRTTVELDRGADLMETLTADLTLARTAAGV